MKARYQAILFAPDGDWVTDHRGCETIDEVITRVADQGSRWFFYPVAGVIRDHGRGLTTGTQRIVDMSEPFEYLKGHTIRKAGDMLAEITRDEWNAIFA